MRFVGTFICLMFALCAMAESPLALRVGTVSIQFPDGWVFQGGTNQHAEGKGPNGERAIVNYRVLTQGAPAEVVEQHWKTIRGFAADKMAGLAAKNGEVSRPLSEVSLANGRVEFSAAAQSKQLTGDCYFIEYLLGSSRSMVFITFEGCGNAAEALAGLDGILATQRWEE